MKHSIKDIVPKSGRKTTGSNPVIPMLTAPFSHHVIIKEQRPDVSDCISFQSSSRKFFLLSRK